MAKLDDVEKPGLALENAESPELASLLRAEIEAQSGARNETPFAILSRDETGALIGGVNGVTHWRWLYVRHLWVAASERGGGLARRLMAEAERLARQRECVGVYIDTFDPRVAAFYERLGFSRAGEILDFPPGGRRLFLSKRL
jgi:GNAT superfamily N-acetyltransferase